ncbi:DUF3310 domain-containing protein [Acinetobacter radioresistens]|uniref:DUF3310 domain-containing protein n=1 Tax=Acinetobacter radioresistens TaxID=40216 RepID=UPI0021CD77F5|nr:DUF3310 domain-containing protein [Acinetobacter radioresistens]MCU4307620.1 DUF3310 domain-containing protein [Acinetobacter radioresistens]
MTKHDNVSRPGHYTAGNIECIEAMQAMMTHEEFIGYLRGNIFKHQWRYKHKNGLEDLRKAQWYQNKLIEAECYKSTPTAILEAERLKCSHIWSDAAADGPARNCLNCGQTEVGEG